jgi:hypothetical protein
MKKYLYSTLVLGLLLVSCGETKTEEAQDKPEKTEIKNCLYAYNPASSKLDWTAYKFLRKAGVGGTFTEINVDAPETSGDAQSMIESLSFSIPISSTETQNDGRNKKIQEFFFGGLASTELISGKVVSLGDSGKAVLAITMNEITQEVEGDYTLDGATFTYNTEIDVNDWNAQAGLAALNEECKDLHTDYENGDTESKLWSDVTIAFSTTLSEICD